MRSLRGQSSRACQKDWKLISRRIYLAMMKVSLQARRWRILVSVAMLVCLIALLIPHAGSHLTFVVCVLFFPVFLFGLLDLREVLRNVVLAGDESLPAAPMLEALFQRPPPAFD
jgi:hypothetical protein